MVYQDLTKHRTNIEDTIKEMDVCALQVNQRDLYLDKSGLRWTAQILSGGFCSNVKIAAGQVFVTPPKLFLGPRGPLVEPSIFSSTRPVRPSATIFPEFIYTGIHAL